MSHTTQALASLPPQLTIAYLDRRYPTSMALLRVWARPWSGSALRWAQHALRRALDRGLDPLGVLEPKQASGVAVLAQGLAQALLAMWDTPMKVSSWSEAHHTAEKLLAGSLVCDDTLVL